MRHAGMPPHQLLHAQGVSRREVGPGQSDVGGCGKVARSEKGAGRGEDHVALGGVSSAGAGSHLSPACLEACRLQGGAIAHR